MTDNVDNEKKVMLYIPFMRFNPLHHQNDQGGTANAFSRLGWKTTLVIGDLLKNMGKSSYEVYLTNNTQINKFSTHMSEIRQFIRIIRKVKPTMLLMWNVGFMPSIVGFVLNFYLSLTKYKPKVSILRLDWDGLRVKNHFLKDFMFYLNLKIASFFFDFITTETTCGQKRIASIIPNPDKLSVVPVGIGDLNVDSDKSQVRKEKILLSIARIARYKNIEGTITVFAQLKDKYPDWNLYIIGVKEDEEYFDELSMLVSSKKLVDRVHFLGELQYDEVEELRKKAPIFITLSKRESFNLARYEAIAHGMTVISSPAGCAEDFDGLVVVNNDEEAVNSICIAIDKFEASRETIVENKFNVKTWEDIAKMFIGLGN